MTATAVKREQAIDWSVVARALPGQSVSGDLHLVTRWSEGALVGVVDGLGHGDEATAAARAAIRVLEEHAGDHVISLVQQCHRALRDTRGAVMTLVSLDIREGTLTTIGIGNVETMIFRANPRARPPRESVLLRGGVVGYQLPALQAHVFPISPDDLVVFATDGLREDFADSIRPSDPLPQIVQRVIDEKFRGTDDGLVLAFKYLGAGRTGA